ncbi:MAG: rRNA maturation RNase YbeY [Clostridiales bacterium]|nr:rRNA maturation RNase YbeY [Clostridiales bacterium]
MTLYIEYETEVLLPIEYESIIRQVVEASIEFEKCPYEVELNVVLTDNNEIAQINKKFRNIDNPTDVLSFPMVDYPNPSDYSIVDEKEEDYFNFETGELMLGDIIISVEKVIEQADNYGHSLKRELGFLVAHSMLHLFGYDHMEAKEMQRMEEKQSKILENLGIGISD